MKIKVEGGSSIKDPRWGKFLDLIEKHKSEYDLINESRVFECFDEAGWIICKGYPKPMKKGKKLKSGHTNYWIKGRVYRDFFGTIRIVIDHHGPN